MYLHVNKADHAPLAAASIDAHRCASSRAAAATTPARGGVPRRVPDRNCVAALVFMALTCTPWVLLPAKELGCGSATTCWRRLDEWAKAGVFDQLQGAAAGPAREAGRIDLERVSVVRTLSA